ncbi:hypothetical protein NQZ68_039475 [Dissostichus eleginoides]|nr:hypothetical protein NQZ68_039475 [Dissostichus eleginoides]
MDAGKRQSANRQMEDDNEMPGTLESYQVPLEFDMPPVSPPKATASSKMLRCPYCPAKFNKPHGLSVHCGMKHYEAVNENQEEKKKQEQEQSETTCMSSSVRIVPTSIPVSKEFKLTSR